MFINNRSFDLYDLFSWTGKVYGIQIFKILIQNVIFNIYSC